MPILGIADGRTIISLDSRGTAESGTGLELGYLQIPTKYGRWTSCHVWVRPRVCSVTVMENCDPLMMSLNVTDNAPMAVVIYICVPSTSLYICIISQCKLNSTEHYTELLREEI